MAKEASKAKQVVPSLVTCHAASKRVHQALGALKAAASKTKDLISKAINVHDKKAEAANTLTTTTAARDAWRDLIQLLEALTPQIDATITSTKSHIVNTSDQVSTEKFVVEFTQNSMATLDVSLDAIATSLSFKRNALNSIFRIPSEVIQEVFQFAVEKEREQLRAGFSLSYSFGTLYYMRRTIPQCPFTLAAVCREWRNIALHTPRLWSYIRVYTVFCAAPTGNKPAKCRWVGKAAFETSLQRAKGAPLELVIYQDPFRQMQTSPNIPPDARISIIYLVRVARVPEWLPSCSCLSLLEYTHDGGSTLKVVQLPSFSTGPKEISCENVLPTFLTPLNSTITFSFCSKKSSQLPDLIRLSENFPNLKTLQLLLPDVSAQSAHPAITSQTWESLKILIITSSVLPSLAAHAHNGLSLPSLTSLILTNVFASFSPSERDSIKHIVRTLTSLEIHDISPSVKPSELRVLIDWMERLQIITLHRAPVQATVEALSITPAKPIKKLIIESMVLEEVELRDYTALLEGEEKEVELRDYTALLEGLYWQCAVGA
jgi:hypothetical protein